MSHHLILLLFSDAPNPHPAQHRCSVPWAMTLTPIRLTTGSPTLTWRTTPSTSNRTLTSGASGSSRSYTRAAAMLTHRKYQPRISCLIYTHCREKDDDDEGEEDAEDFWLLCLRSDSVIPPPPPSHTHTHPRSSHRSVVSSTTISTILIIIISVGGTFLYPLSVRTWVCFPKATSTNGLWVCLCRADSSCELDHLSDSSIYVSLVLVRSVVTLRATVRTLVPSGHWHVTLCEHTVI